MTATPNNEQWKKGDRFTMSTVHTVHHVDNRSRVWVSPFDFLTPKGMADAVRVLPTPYVPQVGDIVRVVGEREHAYCVNIVYETGTVLLNSSLHCSGDRLVLVHRPETPTA